MQLDFWEVLSNLVGLFLLIAVGYIVVRLKIMPAASSAALSQLLLKITLPCTIFVSLQRPYEASFLRDMLVVFTLGMLLLLILMLIARLLSARLCAREDRRGTWTFSATFSNNGFMGFPIVLALFGEEGMALAAVLNLPFNLLVYTVGVVMICSDRPKGAEVKPIRLRSVLCTTMMLSVVLGLACYFARLSAPSAVLTPLTHLSNMTTPLSMIITGMNLSGGRFSALFRDRDILTVSCAGLVLKPLITLALLKLFNMVVPFGNPLILSVVFITMAMPAPGVTTALAEDYGVNREYAAGVVFVTSLCCILTIPVMAMLL